MSEITLNDQNFESEIKQFQGVALVDFWAPWCGPCRIQGSIIDELAKDMKANEKIKITALNVDENQKTAQTHAVLSIPTLIIFKNGEPDETLVGVHQKSVLKEKIEKALKK